MPDRELNRRRIPTPEPDPEFVFMVKVLAGVVLLAVVIICGTILLVATGGLS